AQSVRRRVPGASRPAAAAGAGTGGRGGGSWSCLVLSTVGREGGRVPVRASSWPLAFGTHHRDQLPSHAQRLLVGGGLHAVPAVDDQRGGAAHAAGDGEVVGAAHLRVH